MFSQLNQSPLFANMQPQEIERCVACSGAVLASYPKEAVIFHQQQAPQYLHVLVSGSVSILNDSVSGKRSLIATFDRAGELFGEVFLFRGQGVYDNHAVAATDAQVLQMPKAFLFQTCGENCDFHTRLISNMLGILAQKAYFLNQKLQILSCTTLRQKLARVLLSNADASKRVTLRMNREQLADFLHVARPSISRELMAMQADGLIKIEKKNIVLLDAAALTDILENF